MPRSYSQTEVIHTTPTEIHDWLNDWSNVKAWMGPSLVSIEMLSDHSESAPLCPGMRYRETRKMGKLNAKANIEVIRHDIDNQGVFRHHAVFDDGCNRMICEYEYSPNDTGTDASFVMYTAPNKWWTKVVDVIAGPLVIRMCSKELADHLQQLKHLIEAESQATTDRAE